MNSRKRDKYRKFESGHQKREKKQKLENNLEKQRGALDKFVFPPNIPKIAEIQNEIENYEEEIMLESDIEQPCCSKEFITRNSIEVDENSSLIVNNKIVNKSKEALIDFSDPAKWPQLLTHDMRVEIILNKSENILFFGNYPKNEQNRKFSNKLFYRTMKNGEKITRN